MVVVAVLDIWSEFERGQREGGGGGGLGATETSGPAGLDAIQAERRGGGKEGRGGGKVLGIKRAVASTVEPQELTAAA